MTEGLRGYLLSVCTAAILLSVAQTVLPKNAVRQVATFAGAMMLLLAVITPFVGIDGDEVSAMLKQLTPDAKEIETRSAEGSRELTAALIKQKCEAYILDKAQQLGMSLQVEVVLSETEEYPVPEMVVLTGSVSPEQQKSLSSDISDNLGIPPRRQEWRTS